MKQNSDNEHDRITWTLGDLRAALREGNPDHGTELAFEVSERDERSELLIGEGIERVVFIVSSEVLEAVRRGELDHVPDEAPLEEAFSTTFDCPHCGRPHLA